MTSTAFAEFLLGVAGVAYGTALVLQPNVLGQVASRLFGTTARDLSAAEARLRRGAGVALIAAGMWLVVFAWPQ